MTYFKTKAEQIKTVKGLTDAMSVFENELKTAKNLNVFTNIYNSDILIQMPGDGTSNIIIPTALHVASLSSHERMTLEAWKSDIADKAREAVSYFMKLYPGQPLTWKVDVLTSPHRHSLYLGLKETDASKTAPHVIETVLSRWKSVSMRLSDYLYNPTLTTPNTEFLFGGNNTYTNTHGAIGKFDMSQVAAKDLENSFHLHSFNNYSQETTPAPKPVSTTRVLKVGTKIEYDTLKKECIIYAASLAEKERKHQFSDEILILAKNIHDYTLTFNSEQTIKLTIDFCKNTTSLDVKEDPMVSVNDAQKSQERYATLTQMADELCGKLHTHLTTLHPQMGMGTLTLQSGTTRMQLLNGWEWNFNIDHYTSHIASHTICYLVKYALLMKWANIEKTYKDYILKKKCSLWRTKVNEKIQTYVIRATNPHHAWIVYSSPHNRDKLTEENLALFEVSYPDHSDRNEIKNQTAEDIKTHY
jgi:hypothetical protein